MIKTCKYCNSTSVILFGKYKLTQLYYCKTCGRKFKEDGFLFHMKVAASYINDAMNLYYRGMSKNNIRNFLQQRYDYYPSSSVVHHWIEKYTNYAINHFKDYRPQVSDTWVLYKTNMHLNKGVKAWLLNIMDTRTKFLLASRASLSYTQDDAQKLKEDAYIKAGQTPRQILIADLNAYPDELELILNNYNNCTPRNSDLSGNHSLQSGQSRAVLKNKTWIARIYPDLEALSHCAGGWLVYYNYFKPHLALYGKTPAEAANINYDVKDWGSLGRISPSKDDEISSHNSLISRADLFDPPLLTIYDPLMFYDFINI